MWCIKCKELVGISWQLKRERPLDHKSMQWNEKGGGRREGGDKETELKYARENSWI